MRRIRYTINVTLDGCCDHRAGIPTPELHAHAAAGIARADALLFGRVTYQMMEEAWRPIAEADAPTPGMPDWVVPFAHTIAAAKKYVVSDTLPGVDWNAELVRGADLLATVARLKREPGGEIALGGVTLPGALAAAGLIDEYELLVHQRIAGHGPRLLDGLPAHLDLQLLDTTPVGSGVVAMRFAPKG